MSDVITLNGLDLARRLGVAPEKITRMKQAGLLPPQVVQKTMRRSYWRKSDIDRWLEDGRPATAPPLTREQRAMDVLLESAIRFFDGFLVKRTKNTQLSVLTRRTATLLRMFISNPNIPIKYRHSFAHDTMHGIRWENYEGRLAATQKTELREVIRNLEAAAKNFGLDDSADAKPDTDIVTAPSQDDVISLAVELMTDITTKTPATGKIPSLTRSIATTLRETLRDTRRRSQDERYHIAHVALLSINWQRVVTKLSAKDDMALTKFSFQLEEALGNMD